MANNLQDIRAKLAAMDNKPKSGSSSQSDNAIFPHWNIDEGASCSIRFLPDADENNTFFWKERQVIRLEFPGVLGGEQKKVTVQVPCGEMYDDPCPVLTQIRPWFKMNDPTMEDLARKYWKKRSYLFQGFVRENPLQEESTPENPIRRFVISTQIFNIIKSALLDTDMENIPTDYVNGTDFRVIKTTKGQYADYSTSKWGRKESALTEQELAAIDEHGLFDLKDFLPARPTADHYNAIEEMFEASVNGEMYDPVRWGNYYKPWGIEVPANAATPGLQAVTESAQPAAKPVAKPAETEVDDVPFETNEEAAKKEEAPAAGNAQDILAMIRSRAQ